MMKKTRGKRVERSAGGLLVGLVVMGVIGMAPVEAELIKKPIEYTEGDTTLEGLYVYDDSVGGVRPGVLVAHQWKGLGPYEEKRAEMLAQMGYAVFALDIYGKGVRPETRQEAASQAGKFKSDRALLRERVKAGLQVLRKQAQVNPSKVAAIGYCFGGTTVLELARSGADIAGVVSFHGGLGSPTPEDAKEIRCKVLALHGADDPHVKEAEVESFKEEMRAGEVDWYLVSYGDAVHSFTDWFAGTDKSQGAAYNERADRRSWQAMKHFFDEIF